MSPFAALLILTVFSAGPIMAQPSPDRDIRILGKVTDVKGSFIAGALAKLKITGLTAVSDNAGEFALLYQASGHRVPKDRLLNQAPEAFLHKDKLIFKVWQNTSVSLSIFSLPGKNLSSTKRQMEPGMHSVPLAGFPTGLFFLKIASNSREILFKGVSGGRNGHYEAPFPLSAISSAIAKGAAPFAPFNDTLTITKDGYQDYQLHLTTADTSGLEIKLLKKGVLPKFSFFVTSLKSLRELSGNQDGFGGDLRFGETGPGAGLRGADKICATIAEKSMPGSSVKAWRAFLSVTADENGTQVDAINRVGNGPWYDRLGRILSNTREELLHDRPAGAHPQIKNDLPNEFGVPNHDPDGTGEVDNHHFLTGSDKQGKLYAGDATCRDWTSTEKSAGRPRIGYSWPMPWGKNWISHQDEAGCGPGGTLVPGGGPDYSNPVVGSGGGYGGFYCFALSP